MSVVSHVAFTETPRNRDSQPRRARDESKNWRDDGNSLPESFTLLMISTIDIPKVIGGSIFFVFVDKY